MKTQSLRLIGISILLMLALISSGVEQHQMKIRNVSESISLKLDLDNTSGRNKRLTY